MVARQVSGVEFYQFANLLNCKGLWHGIFTRRNGCSPAPFDSLNVAYGLGDEAGNVARNRSMICRAIGPGRMITARQVHGRGIRVLSADDPAEFCGDSQLPGDALVTDLPGLFLTIQVADCQAVLLYDPRKRVAANVHSGWRGSIRNIIAGTIQTMTDRFGCRSRDLMAAVGPSLGPCCAEFVNYRHEIPAPLWSYKCGADHFDFWAMSRDQLLGTGVPDGHICLSRQCTKCRTDQFFSYRGESHTGRFAAVIALQPD